MPYANEIILFHPIFACDTNHKISKEEGWVLLTPFLFPPLHFFFRL